MHQDGGYFPPLFFLLLLLPGPPFLRLSPLPLSFWASAWGLQVGRRDAPTPNLPNCGSSNRVVWELSAWRQCRMVCSGSLCAPWISLCMSICLPKTVLEAKGRVMLGV